MELAGRVALVTGAGSGIGRATALRFAREGARVVALSWTEPHLDETVALIEAAGGEAVPLVADVSRAAEMEQALAQAAAQWGRLDIVVANAGLNGVWASLEELTPEEWDFTLRVNLTGTFHTVKYAVPYLKERGGAVVVVASVNGTRIFSNTGATAYACAKGGQVIFTKMVALELARYGIRVNAVCPGAIATNIRTRTTLRNVDAIRVPVEFPEGWHPLRGDVGDPDDVAKAILFLASDQASHISGVEIYVDGAESLLRG